MPNPSASTIIGLVRDLLRAEAQSDVPVIGNSFLLQAVSDGNMKWNEAHGISGESPVLFQRETGFDLASETAIDDAAGTTTATVTVTVDSTTGYESSGAAVAWDDNMPDIFAYTSKTATTFDGVTGLGFAHEDNDIISPLYALPTNFGGFRETPTQGDGVSLNGMALRYMGGPPVPGHFSIYDDGTTQFLWLPRGSTGSASVFYNKTSATIDSIDDTVDVPETYKMFLVWHCLSYCYVGREQSLAAFTGAKDISEGILKMALTRRNTGRVIPTRPIGRSARDYITVGGRQYPIF